MYSKDIVEAALRGKVHVEFTEVRLERKGSDGKDAVSGTGYLEQIGDHFKFVFIQSGKRSPGPYFYMRHYTQGGLIIQEDCFFTAICRSFDGKSWTVDDVLPDANEGSGGVVVYSRVRKVAWRERLHEEHKVLSHIETLYILGVHEFPPNEFKETQTSVGGSKILTQSQMSIAKVRGVPGLDIGLERLEAHTVLTATSSAPIPDKYRICAWQSLEFMFAQQLCCVATVKVHGDIISGILEPWQDPKKLPSVEPPIEPHRHDVIDIYWELFSKILLFLLKPGDASEALAASSGEVISSGKTLLGIQAKIRGVAVETLTKQIVHSRHPLSTAPLREVLAKHLDETEYPQSFRDRVKGMLNNMDGVSVKDVLYGLLTMGVVQQGHIDSWGKLRNKYAHGAAAKASDVETALNHMRAVVGLYYRLVFHLVGYSGSSTDYLVLPRAPVTIVEKGKEGDPAASAPSGPT